MSYTTNILHCVWSTKNRAPLLHDTKRRYQLFDHIKAYTQVKGILLDCIGGTSDHIHCLLFLNPQQKLSDVIQLIKGGSSYWYNNQGRGKLTWQTDYFAISVSPDRISNVRSYIRRQEEHHKKVTFGDEYNKFLEEYAIRKTWLNEE